MRARLVVLGLGTLSLAGCGAGVSSHPGTEPRPDAPYEVLPVRGLDAGTDALAATDALIDVSDSEAPRSYVSTASLHSDAGDAPPSETAGEIQDGGSSLDGNEDDPQVPLDALVDRPPLLDGAPETAPPSDAGDALPPQIVQFPLPTQNAYPAGVALGPDGNVWFTEIYGNKIGRITPNGTITEFDVLTSSSFPERICAGPDGYLWFTESNAGRIGRISVMGDVTEFNLSVASPEGITAGPDGNIWFVEYLKIGRITPLGQDLTEFAVPATDARLAVIVSGSDGNLWVSDLGGILYRVTLAGVITPFDTPTSASGALGLASDPLTGRLWFTEGNTNVNQIGTMDPRVLGANPTMAFSEFPIPTTDSGAVGITGGTDGGAWFTENHSGRIGHVSAGGAITEYGIPTSDSTAATPVNIVADKNGNLWFTNSSANSIGRLSPP